jgi:predicted acetyltransferase
VWGRARRPRKRHNRGFVFFDDGALEAYVYVSQTQRESHGIFHDLWASDLCARSARGYAAIFKLLRAQRSVAENLEFRCGTGAPFLGLLRENRFEEKPDIDWMVRVTRVEVALEQRGYPEHVRANVSFKVRDAAIPRNDGAWSLAIAEGRAHVERGGRGEVALDVAQLAPLYTGYLPATTLRRLGMIECEARTARLLDEIFRSPMPTICDMF